MQLIVCIAIFVTLVGITFATKNIYLDGRTAKAFLKVTRRDAVIKELGGNEVAQKPWNWAYGENFRYNFKELRELTRYPGAWWKKPDNFRFEYIPTDDELRSKIIRAGEDKYSFLWLYVWEAKNNPGMRSKYKPDEEFFTILWRYSQCLRGVNKIRNCPG